MYNARFISYWLFYNNEPQGGQSIRQWYETLRLFVLASIKIFQVLVAEPTKHNCIRTVHCISLFRNLNSALRYLFTSPPVFDKTDRQMSPALCRWQPRRQPLLVYDAFRDVSNSPAAGDTTTPPGGLPVKGHMSDGLLGKQVKNSLTAGIRLIPQSASSA